MNIARITVALGSATILIGCAGAGPLEPTPPVSVSKAIWVDPPAPPIVELPPIDDVPPILPHPPAEDRG